ncbi:hypothetical protein [Paenibacillus contaminans]|uniref:Uncharacterized protein n=1 Tax=Paenibacillus contaminans TaxID=450362 RepID=A0A329M3W8_9BACL|nr:hypothetical protein [Paenibacillus contaminans]RAV14875.1 hypothetical protein DQG23_31075 [Paenibacillus contaminans]
MTFKRSTFKVRTVAEITEPFTSKSREISGYMRSKLCALPLDVVQVINIMQHLTGKEIAAEMVFCDDRGDNQYSEYESLEKRYVQIARNGQGDAWLMNLADGLISFFDHDRIDPVVSPLFIDFWRFLQLADLIRQYEQIADGVDHFEESAEYMELIEQLSMIHPNLPENYPFDFV